MARSHARMMSSTVTPYEHGPMHASRNGVRGGEILLIIFCCMSEDYLFRTHTINIAISVTELALYLKLEPE